MRRSVQPQPLCSGRSCPGCRCGRAPSSPALPALPAHQKQGDVKDLTSLGMGVMVAGGGEGWGGSRRGQTKRETKQRQTKHKARVLVRSELVAKPLLGGNLGPQDHTGKSEIGWPDMSATLMFFFAAATH